MTDEAKRIVAGLRNFSVSDTVEYVNKIVSNARKAAVLIESLSAELDRVTKERDAAVEGLRDWAFCGDCEHNAKSTQEEPCKTCISSSGKAYWQWRGVKED